MVSELPRPAARHSGGNREPTPGIAPGCVAAGRVDALDLDGNRAQRGQLRGFCGA